MAFPQDWSNYWEINSINPPSQISGFVASLNLSLLAGLSSVAKSDGSDIRVTNSDGNIIPCDLMPWYNSGFGQLLIGIVRTTGNQPIRVWAGNPNATSSDINSVSGQYAVYNDNIVCFYPSGGGQDRTKYQNHLSMSGGVLPGNTGAMQTGQHGTFYNSSNTQYGVAITPMPYNTTQASIIAWENPATTVNDFCGIMTFRGKFSLYHQSTRELRYAWLNTSPFWGFDSNITPPANTWSQTAALISPGSGTLFVNTTEAVNNISHTTVNHSGTNLHVANDDTFTRKFNGGLSNLLLANINVGPDWVRYSHEMGSNPSFWTVTSSGVNQDKSFPSGWTNYWQGTAVAPSGNVSGYAAMLNLGYLTGLQEISNASGADIRVTDTNNNLIPFDLIPWTSSGDGSIYINLGPQSGTSKTVRVWAGNPNAENVVKGADYGQYNTYRSGIIAFYPFGGGEDRTRYNHHGTAFGTSIGSGLLIPEIGMKSTEYIGTGMYSILPGLASYMGLDATLSIMSLSLAQTPSTDATAGYAVMGVFNAINGATNIPWVDNNGYNAIFRATNAGTISRINTISIPNINNIWRNITTTTTPGLNGWNFYHDSGVTATASGLSNLFHNNDEWSLARSRNSTAQNYGFNGYFSQAKITSYYSPANLVTYETFNLKNHNSFWSGGFTKFRFPPQSDVFVTGESNSNTHSFNLSKIIRQTNGVVNTYTMCQNNNSNTIKNIYATSYTVTSDGGFSQFIRGMSSLSNVNTVSRALLGRVVNSWGLSNTLTYTRNTKNNLIRRLIVLSNNQTASNAISQLLIHPATISQTATKLEVAANLLRNVSILCNVVTTTYGNLYTSTTVYGNSNTITSSMGLIGSSMALYGLSNTRTNSDKTYNLIRGIASSSNTQTTSQTRVSLLKALIGEDLTNTSISLSKSDILRAISATSQTLTNIEAATQLLRGVNGLSNTQTAAQTSSQLMRNVRGLSNTYTTSYVIVASSLDISALSNTRTYSEVRTALLRGIVGNSDTRTTSAANLFSSISIGGFSAINTYAMTDGSLTRGITSLSNTNTSAETQGNLIRNVWGFSNNLTSSYGSLFTSTSVSALSNTVTYMSGWAKTTINAYSTSNTVTSGFGRVRATLGVIGYAPVYTNAYARYEGSAIVGILGFSDTRTQALGYTCVYGDVRNGLVGWWPMQDTGNTMMVAARRGSDGLLYTRGNGAESFTNASNMTAAGPGGLIDRSLFFNGFGGFFGGTGQFMEVNPSDGYFRNVTQASVSIWAYMNRLTTTRNWVMSANISSSTSRFEMELENYIDRKIGNQYGLKSEMTSNDSVTSVLQGDTDPVYTGQWYNFIVTANLVTKQVNHYINGINVFSGSGNFPTTGFPNTDVMDIRLATHGYGLDVDDDKMNARLADFRIYHRELTANEARTLNSRGRDTCIPGYDIEVYADSNNITRSQCILTLMKGIWGTSNTRTTSLTILDILKDIWGASDTSTSLTGRIDKTAFMSVVSNTRTSTLADLTTSAFIELAGFINAVAQANGVAQKITLSNILSATNTGSLSRLDVMSVLSAIVNIRTMAEGSFDTGTQILLSGLASVLTNASATATISIPIAVESKTSTSVTVNKTDLTRLITAYIKAKTETFGGIVDGVSLSGLSSTSTKTVGTARILINASSIVQVLSAINGVLTIAVDEEGNEVELVVYICMNDDNNTLYVNKSRIIDLSNNQSNNIELSVHQNPNISLNHPQNFSLD